MNTPRSFLTKFFGVAIRGQTYLNLLYLSLAFPLGLFYFVFLVTGFSLGFGLLIVWVGILILAGMLAAGWAGAVFERQLAIGLLHEEIPPLRSSAPAGAKTWEQIKSHLTNPVTWKSLVYLLAKFPLGILTFVVLVTLVGLMLAFLAAPLIFYPGFPMVTTWTFGNSIITIDTWWEAMLSFLVGVALIFPCLHILNGLARISGRFARVMFS